MWQIRDEMMATITTRLDLRRAARSG